MKKMDYLKFLVDEIHSTTVATIGSDGHPQTRIIDMMYYDEEGVYFLTAKGKAFYGQLIGTAETVQTGYFVGKDCIGCKLCYSVCPQKCIDISSVPLQSIRIIACIAEDVQRFARNSVLRKEVNYDL